jgi:hypothetical protein
MSQEIAISVMGRFQGFGSWPAERGRPSAEVRGFIVMFLRLRKMPIDAIEIFAMALLRWCPARIG